MAPERNNASFLPLGCDFDAFRAGPVADGRINCSSSATSPSLGSDSTA